MSESLDVSNFVDVQIEEIRRAVGDSRLLIAVSGGVDSTTSAILTHRAIGDNLICIFIDDNFMRLGEPQWVKEVLSSPPMNLPVRVLDERERFMEALKGLGDAEEKRKVFRETFYRVLGETIEREGCTFLVQGTIKADIIETVGGIKTQHNVLEQIGIDPVERFGFKVIEPVKSLYKYQVREVAKFLGAPQEISERQPFPGPGLSVRVVGEIVPEKLEELKRATVSAEGVLGEIGAAQYFAAIFDEAFDKEDDKELGGEAASALGISPSHLRVDILRERGTGMLGGKRAYGKVATVSAEDSGGGVLETEWKRLRGLQESIQRRHPEFTRILYWIDGREEGEYLIALRAVKTKNFITAEVAEASWPILKRAAEKVLEDCPRVSGVYFDITPKPPATIEFE